MSEEHFVRLFPFAAGISVLSGRRAGSSDPRGIVRGVAGLMEKELTHVRVRRGHGRRAAGGISSRGEHVPFDIPVARRPRPAAGNDRTCGRDVPQRARTQARTRAAPCGRLRPAAGDTDDSCRSHAAARRRTRGRSFQCRACRAARMAGAWRCAAGRCSLCFLVELWLPVSYPQLSPRAPLFAETCSTRFAPNEGAGRFANRPAGNDHETLSARRSSIRIRSVRCRPCSCS